MREHRRTIHRGVRNVIYQRPSRRVETREIANSLCDFMIGARGIAADSEPADDLPIQVQRNTASEKDQPARNAILASTLPARRGEEAGIEQVGLAQTPK